MKFFISLGICVFYSLLGISQNKDNQLNEYINFLNTQNISAKEYILELFDRYDIVVLCERHHQEMTQYDLIFDIVSDKRFIDNHGQIIMEVGVANSHEKLNAFLHNDTLSDDKVEDSLLSIIRNNDFNPLWEMTNYPTFIKNLYYLNKNLPGQQKITVYPVDVPFSWNTVASQKEYKAVMDTIDSFRSDEIMGVQMQKIVTEHNHNKFLIIMNHYHSWFIPEKYGAAWWIKNKFPEKTVNVLLNNVLQGNLTDDGRWDAAFKITNKEDLGFDMANTPFGKTNFNKYLIKWYDNEIDGVLKQHNKMQDFFHGYVFYKPIEKQILSYGYPNYIEGEFKKEFDRRSKIAFGKLVAFFGKYKIRKHYNKVRQKQYNNIDKQINKRDEWIDNNK
ncbi:MAG: hypothetical protein LBG15_05795 [Dysgonamonadaceae bacterium]|jgi:hypothetical protein|nr:hypothetical protein [Dysgonamonadaceae bacterium]